MWAHVLNILYILQADAKDIFDSNMFNRDDWKKYVHEYMQMNSWEES